MHRLHSHLIYTTTATRVHQLCQKELEIGSGFPQIPRRSINAYKSLSSRTHSNGISMSSFSPSSEEKSSNGSFVVLSPKDGDMKEKASKSAVPASPKAARGVCLCSPTTHQGSFRCRFHRSQSTNWMRRSKSMPNQAYSAAAAASTNPVNISTSKLEAAHHN